MYQPTNNTKRIKIFLHLASNMRGATQIAKTVAEQKHTFCNQFYLTCIYISDIFIQGFSFKKTQR